MSKHQLYVNHQLQKIGWKIVYFPTLNPKWEYQNKEKNKIQTYFFFLSFFPLFFFLSFPFFIFSFLLSLLGRFSFFQKIDYFPSPMPTPQQHLHTPISLCMQQPYPAAPCSSPCCPPVAAMLFTPLLSINSHKKEEKG